MRPRSIRWRRWRSARTATISVYARNRDYHELIKGRLKELAGLLARRVGGRGEGLRRHRAADGEAAGGSGGAWLAGQAHRAGEPRVRLAGSFSARSSRARSCPYDEPHPESCGTCSKCLDVCPTNAFPAPFQLDARRCIAYLTVEHQGPIPHEFRAAIGNRIFGCDDCLAVCPWNKFAQASHEAKLMARDELDGPCPRRSRRARRCGVPQAVRRLAGQAARPLRGSCAMC